MNHGRGAAAHGSEWLSAATPAGCPPFPVSLLASPGLGFCRTCPSAPSHESCSFVFTGRIGVCGARLSVCRHFLTGSSPPSQEAGAPRSTPARVSSSLTAQRFPILPEGKSRPEDVRWPSKGKGGGERSWASRPPPPAPLLPLVLGVQLSGTVQLRDSLSCRNIQPLRKNHRTRR